MSEYALEIARMDASTGNTSVHLELNDEQQIMLQVEYDKVNDAFTCPLCKGYFREAHTIAECVHSFCKSCIIKHLQDVQECPTCKIKTTMNTIRPDFLLQSLFAQLYPEVERDDEEQEKAWYQAHNLPMPEKQIPVHLQNKQQKGKSKRLKAANESTTSANGQQQNTSQTAAATRSVSTNNATSSKASSSPTNPTAPPSLPPQRVRLALKNENSNGKQLDKPMLEMGSHTSVEKVRDYLAKNLGESFPDRITVRCNGQLLSLPHSVEFVQKTIWKDPQMMMTWTFHIG